MDSQNPIQKRLSQPHGNQQGPEEVRETCEHPERHTRFVGINMIHNSGLYSTTPSHCTTGGVYKFLLAYATLFICNITFVRVSVMGNQVVPACAKQRSVKRRVNRLLHASARTAHIIIPRRKRGTKRASNTQNCRTCPPKDGCVLRRRFVKNIPT